jgi:glycosidase
MNLLKVQLAAFERDGARKTAAREMEFHICKDVRTECGIEVPLFALSGNVVFADFHQVRLLAQKLNVRGHTVKAGQLGAMGLIDEILHYLVALYREQVQGDVFETALSRLEQHLGDRETALLLQHFCERFPPRTVYAGETSVDRYLQDSALTVSNKLISLEELLLLALANLNPAFKPFLFMFDETPLAQRTAYAGAVAELEQYLKSLPAFGEEGLNLWDLLRAPALACPDSLSGQLEFMRKKWGLLIQQYMARMLTGMDIVKEEEKPHWTGGPGGETEVMTYSGSRDVEYEKFSPDQDWMPKTVLLAKSTLVWLYQLSKKFNAGITRLDQVPDEELDELARRGFTGLWLIGLWERSTASKTIKQWTGNPDAAASAYSLYDYDIAAELGGWAGLQNLRERCCKRGIRLGSDMVPNHTGIDSRWMTEHPDRFLQLLSPPFPAYTYSCENLSGCADITVQIEDHYFSRNDAAVVFKRTDNNSGEVRYIYHGNDGTSMPWNDTAQIDFLNPEAREAVIRTIIGVCQQFPIVRFDAAMTLAKRHIQRLWYPEPGRGGDIASRSEHALTNDEFDRRIPNEFWREVVDRCALEAPHTLLLAEAFWMMEGYFVRTLGMHRVYNSAFMNMLKREENSKYRDTIKNTLEFDPEILKRFVNFMNNPDEETAVAQFGKGDKYFGICTLMITLPGLPMFGHGQVEGLEEKYGMEYRRAYRDETPDQWLIGRHEHEIFPLMKKRTLFSGSADFCIYDLYTHSGEVNENVYAYTNRSGADHSLVFYNNSYNEASGWINHGAVNIPQKGGGFRKDTLSQALDLSGDFVLLFEQRSALWFIRPVKEIAERGLFVSLKGYEVQVFLDIHSVEDADGRWSRLCNELNGRGVQDLGAAVQDIFLNELYTPFKALFTEECIQNLCSAFARCKAEGADAGAPFIEGLKAPAFAFIHALIKYLRGADGRYEAFTTATYYPLQAEIPEAATLWDDFAAFFHRLFELPLITKKLLPAAALDPAEAALLSGFAVFTLLRSALGKGGSGADTIALIKHWQLDRKLKEAYGALGLSGDGVYRGADLMKALIVRTAPAAPLDKPFAQSLIMDNRQLDDFRWLLGINVFNDVVWFNKEAFDTVLRFAPVFLALEPNSVFEPAPGGGKKPAALKADTMRAKRVKLIANTAAKLGKAGRKSAYRLDKLLEALNER